jgi:lipopolysaccharide transport system permease protein
VSEPPLTRIEATRGWRGLGLAELWRHRELVYFLAWRDVKVRYKQTALGALWAVLQPLLAMLVFWLFLGRLAGVPSDGLPYPPFALCGLVLWGFVGTAVTFSSNSLVGYAHVIRKVYFPRMAAPMAPVLAGLIDLLIALGLLLVVQAAFGVWPGLWLWLAPLSLLVALSAALGAGLWLAALNVEFRDVRFAVPFLTQIWMFVSPVVYPASLVPKAWRPLYALNPLCGAIEGFRLAWLGRSSADGSMIVISAAAALALLLSGAYYFRRVERRFADTL